MVLLKLIFHGEIGKIILRSVPVYTFFLRQSDSLKSVLDCLNAVIKEV